MTHQVRIYLLQRGVDIWGWYCTRCLKEQESAGWSVRQSKDPDNALPCQGDKCRQARNTGSAA